MCEIVVISDLVTTMSKKITDAAIAAGLIACSDDEQSENIPQLPENDHLLNTPINTNTEFSFELNQNNLENEQNNTHGNLLYNIDWNNGNTDGLLTPDSKNSSNVSTISGSLKDISI